MIVTHTKNGLGQTRVYLGGKASLECWVEPAADGIAWTLHLSETPCGLPVSDDAKRAWAKHTLLKLADQLRVAPSDLAAVPFESIMALHSADPFLHARVPASRRPNMDYAYVATVPHSTRPASMDSASAYAHRRR